MSFNLEKAPRLLYSGLDLHRFRLNINAEPFPSEKFDDAIQNLRDKRLKKGMTWDIAGHLWHFTDKKPGGYFVFAHENLTISICTEMPYAPVKVQVHAHGVMVGGGFDAQHQVVKDFLAEFNMIWEDEPAHLIRQDTHWIFAVPRIDLDQRNIWMPRLRKGSLNFDIKTGTQTLGFGKRGRGGAWVRKYDKREEIKAHKTVWQIPLLDSWGLRPDEAAVSVEIEIGGYVCKEFGLASWELMKSFHRRLERVLVTEQFRLVYPYDRSVPHFERHLRNLPDWDAIVADVFSDSDKLALRAPVVVKDSERKRYERALTKYESAASSVRAFAQRARVEQETASRHMLIILGWTNSPNLIEAHAKRIGIYSTVHSKSEEDARQKVIADKKAAQADKSAAKADEIRRQRVRQELVAYDDSLPLLTEEQKWRVAGSSERSIEKMIDREYAKSRPPTSIKKPDDDGECPF